MLEVQNVSVNYRGVRALEPLSIDFAAGELVGLIGPNGAGKSTLIKAILGLVPASGRVLWNGLPLRRQRQRVAYVPQRSQIDWDYPTTVWNVVLMGTTALRGWWRPPGREAQRRAYAALERVDLVGLRDRAIGALSGGQQQRVFLGRALAQQADLFLLDEPFTGVDRKTEAMMLAVFSALKAQGKTLLVCSHEWGDRLQQYDRLLLLNQQLLADDRPEGVMTLENIHRAYGQNLQLVKPSADLPFVC
ncbi:metal ABC transporter ATP-binding protein [Romeria aff. gracilis LEGE 07310]|uniref:Metal ABC transporter ATP-binding protein n=1 Tax=Vasconcelosia minhoensis LEGE 07310 TaxID=915328 RepID=A0A8J7A8V0_9CYAN|nr:metal ABC transporter ATP-binding protein [Romeria gracilis]MBE9078175.1 metal ABC transporter ATP-binding protein [Romeria aff. gracilis LEGE 07310]